MDTPPVGSCWSWRTLGLPGAWYAVAFDALWKYAETLPAEKK